MRADRLLSILLLLQVHRRMTAGALADRLEVSPRTIHRDMEALSMAGVPVYAERGGGGGWVLPESYRTDVSGLSGDEIQALFVAVPARLLADLGLEQASEGALVKLLAAMPASGRQDAEHVRQRLHVDGAGWHQAQEQVPALTVVQEAVWLDRKLRLTYQRGDGSCVERTVDPLGLVAKGRLWYLVAAVHDEPRTYRVSRVQAAEILDQPARRPDDFDLAAFWARSSAELISGLPRYPIVVRVAQEVVRRLWIPGSYARVEQVSEPDDDGWCTVSLTLQTEVEACSYVLGFGPSMEVVEPTELRHRVIQVASEIVASYRIREVAEHDRASLSGGAPGQASPSGSGS